MAGWTSDELLVLVATFCGQPFRAGDDAHPTCQALAAAFGRGAAGVDRQWRNVRALLYRPHGSGSPGNIGENVREAVEAFRGRTVELAAAAREACDRNGWDLASLLPSADRRESAGSTPPTTDTGVIQVLLWAYITEPRSDLGLPPADRVDELSAELGVPASLVERTLECIHQLLHADPASPPSAGLGVVHDVVNRYRGDFQALRRDAQRLLSALASAGEPQVVAGAGSDVSLQRSWQVRRAATPLSTEGNAGMQRNRNANALLEHRLEGRFSVALDTDAPDGVSSVYVETGLDDAELSSRIRGRCYRLVIVLGTPGDGKSRFLKRFEATTDDHGVDLAVRHDAAFADTVDENAEIDATRAFLASAGLEGEESLASSDWASGAGHVALLGINRGLYDALFRSPRSEHRWIHAAGVRVGATRESPGVLVLDLGRRYALGGLAATSILLNVF